MPFPGSLCACPGRLLAEAKLSEPRSRARFSSLPLPGRRGPAPRRASDPCSMEREPGDGSLFFRGLQNRAREKVKLRQRRSALYLRPQRSRRRGGERGGRARRERRGLHLLGGGRAVGALPTGSRPCRPRGAGLRSPATPFPAREQRAGAAVLFQGPGPLPCEGPGPGVGPGPAPPFHSPLCLLCSGCEVGRRNCTAQVGGGGV